MIRRSSLVHTRTWVVPEEFKKLDEVAAAAAAANDARGTGLS